MKQVTLVSLYGQKAKPLSQLIHGCSEIIQRSALQSVYRPYDTCQIHATIIGMEKLTGYSKHFNANIWRDSGNRIKMDFSNLLPTLSKYFPMTIRLGGFQPSFNAFDSLGRCPYQRSFQVQWPTNRITLIGWPHTDGDFTTVRQLSSLRNEIAETCNIKHKYMDDNDLFMVLGEIASPDITSEHEIKKLHDTSCAIEKEVRDYLSGHALDVVIDMDDVCIAQYEVKSLPLNSTACYRASNKQLNADFMGNLFS